MTAVLYIMTAGAATLRRVQGGAAALPGASAGVAAAAGRGEAAGGMFSHKEYSKVGGGAQGRASQGWSARDTAPVLEGCIGVLQAHAARPRFPARAPHPPSHRRPYHASTQQEDLPEKRVKRFADVKGCDEAIGELQARRRAARQQWGRGPTSPGHTARLASACGAPDRLPFQSAVHWLRAVRPPAFLSPCRRLWST